jgi:hypothetical protein
MTHRAEAGPVKLLHCLVMLATGASLLPASAKRICRQGI